MIWTGLRTGTDQYMTKQTIIRILIIDLDLEGLRSLRDRSDGWHLPSDPFNLSGFHRNHLMSSLLINTGDDLTISSSGKYCMNFITITIGIFCTNDRQDLTHTLHEFFHRLFFFL